MVAQWLLLKIFHWHDSSQVPRSPRTLFINTSAVATNRTGVKFAASFPDKRNTGWILFNPPDIEKPSWALALAWFPQAVPAPRNGAWTRRTNRPRASSAGMEGFVPLWGTASAHTHVWRNVFFWGTTRKNKGLKYGLVLKHVTSNSNSAAHH